MNRLLIILFFLFPIIIISFNGCEENELDEPTTLHLQISMEELGNSDENRTKAGKPMQINGGTTAIESIEFEGSRENAKNYYFSRSFENGLIGDLDQNKLNKDVTFDIPQGSYNPAKITLHLSSIDSLYGFMLHGTYNSPVFEETRIEFEFFENNEQIEIMIQNTKGNNKVLFKKGKNQTLNIQINLNQLFAYFNPKRLEEAETTQEGNTQKIIISPTQNEELYYDLVNRIDKSIKAILK